MLVGYVYKEWKVGCRTPADASAPALPCYGEHVLGTALGLLPGLRGPVRRPPLLRLASPQGLPKGDYNTTRQPWRSTY